MEDTKAITLDAGHLHKLQRELLEILLEFDRICKAAGIRYVLSSGTLLGAVRHQGFIPWDDDMDVEMLRPDYERFCQVVDQFIDHERFFFQNTDTDTGYRWVFGKMRRKNTEYIRVGQTHLRQQTGLCIDVFPLDEAQGEGFGQWLRFRAASLCRKFLWSPVGARHASSAMARYFFWLLSKVPRDWVLACYRRIVIGSRHHTDGARLVSYNADDVLDKSYERSWFEKTVDLAFEGHPFPAPQGYDEVLTLSYGDYMRLPPPAEQKGVADAFVIRFSDGETLCGDDGCFAGGGSAPGGGHTGMKE